SNEQKRKQPVFCCSALSNIKKLLDRLRDAPFFYGLKYFIFAILVIVFLLYLVYLIYKIITDIPIESTGYIIVDEIDVPVINLGDHRSSCNTFKANKTIKYTNTDSSLDDLRQIGFYFNIPNISIEESTNIGIASLSIQLISPDFNPLLNPKQVKSDMDKAILSNLQLQWNFVAGMANYVALVKFRTIAYKTILPNDARAIIGLTPNYHVTYSLESDTHYFPFNTNPSGVPNGTTGYFSVAAGNFIQEQTIEQRSYTVFSALAAAGGFTVAPKNIRSNDLGKYDSRDRDVTDSILERLAAIEKCLNIKPERNIVYDTERNITTIDESVEG
ncbi:28287_t:CDS:2, partial [Dentiscutata erythropus]